LDLFKLGSDVRNLGGEFFNGLFRFYQSARRDRKQPDTRTLRLLRQLVDQSLDVLQLLFAKFQVTRLKNTSSRIAFQLVEVPPKLKSGTPETLIELDL
jgi:hypothetical protein